VPAWEHAVARFREARKVIQDSSDLRISLADATAWGTLKKDGERLTRQTRANLTDNSAFFKSVAGAALAVIATAIPGVDVQRRAEV